MKGPDLYLAVAGFPQILEDTSLCERPLAAQANRHRAKSHASHNQDEYDNPPGRYPTSLLPRGSGVSGRSGREGHEWLGG